MWTALLSKEMRECGLYAGLALLAELHFLGAGMDLPLIPMLSNARGGEIPFLAYYQTGREEIFTTIAVIAAVVIGLHQTVWESWRQTTLFLLHRPMPRHQIFLGKLLAGVMLLSAATALPLLLYALWASAPGTHPSPFYWSMTETWWRGVLVGLVCYLGAFLSGLRSARWIGSKTWPLITVILLALVLKYGETWVALIYVGFTALAAGLLISILDTVRVREFP